MGHAQVLAGQAVVFLVIKGTVAQQRGQVQPPVALEYGGRKPGGVIVGPLGDHGGTPQVALDLANRRQLGPVPDDVVLEGGLAVDKMLVEIAARKHSVVGISVGTFHDRMFSRAPF